MFAFLVEETYKNEKYKVVLVTPYFLFSAYLSSENKTILDKSPYMEEKTFKYMCTLFNYVIEVSEKQDQALMTGLLRFIADHSSIRYILRL